MTSDSASKSGDAAAPEATGKVKVGFIGLGNMGKPMAMNLIKSGYELTVWARRREVTAELISQGARWADSPRAVAQASRVVITALPGPPEVEAVALGPDGICEGVHRGDFYIDTSTSIPSSICRIAAVALKKGVEVLDAPIAGGVRGARRGTLTFMVGASQHAFEFCEPIFKGMGEHVFHMGDVGAGYATKLVNNMMTICNALCSMEGMVMGARAGVNVQKLYEVIDGYATGGSYAMKNLFAHVILPGRFEPTRWALSLVTKDVRLAAEYARELGVPITLGPCAFEAFSAAMRQGLGDKDWSNYIRLLEKAVGVEVRGVEVKT